jgi:hypothetical protein
VGVGELQPRGGVSHSGANSSGVRWTVKRTSPLRRQRASCSSFRGSRASSLEGSCADCAMSKLGVGRAPRVRAHHLRSLCCKIAAEGDWA